MQMSERKYDHVNKYYEYIIKFNYENFYLRNLSFMSWFEILVL